MKDHTPAEPQDRRDGEPIIIGNRLRDAAVDPEPGDYLAPTNAGVPGPLGNPHSRHVVSPEVRDDLAQRRLAEQLRNRSADGPPPAA